jgi:hypothetical protein
MQDSTHSIKSSKGCMDLAWLSIRSSRFSERPYHTTREKVRAAPLRPATRILLTKEFVQDHGDLLPDFKDLNHPEEEP